MPLSLAAGVEPACAAWPGPGSDDCTEGPGGSEVTIQITDPRVGWCGPAPRVTGNQLMVLGIGENISTRQVETSGANAGLTKGNADPHGGSPGGTVPGAPFGGVLEPRVIFGDTLVGSGITHYRWSYRRLTNAQGTAVADDYFGEALSGSPRR